MSDRFASTRPDPGSSREERAALSGEDDLRFHAISSDGRGRIPGEMSQKDIYALYSAEEQRTMRERLERLSVLGKYIGRDFDMPVELNIPGEGWHWDSKRNVVRVDPKDLLELPMDRLRFIVSHEGGHRRVTRMDPEMIPPELLKQPGFHHMWNCLEDCRMNNFVAQGDPAFREQMKTHYRADIAGGDAQQAELIAEGKLGHVPKSIRASLEYIRQWFEVIEGREMKVRPELPPEIREVMEKTLPSAKRIWNSYPSKKEADTGEEPIRRYVRHSMDVMLNGSERLGLEPVWPHIKKLVEEDIKDQQVQQQLKDAAENGIPQDLDRQLTPGEKEELEKALEEAIDKGELELGDEATPGAKPIPLDQLSPELREKLEKYIEGLPDEKKQSLRERAEKALDELERELNEKIEAKLKPPEEGEANQDAQPADPAEAPPPPPGASPKSQAAVKPPPVQGKPPERKGEREREKGGAADDYRKYIEQVLARKGDVYQQHLTEVAPIVRELERELRGIFVERTRPRREAGRRDGDTMNISRRIEEIASNIKPEDSRAWERTARPTQKDYAITLLIDLSGSMRDKIDDTFKAAIVLSEVLGKFGIRTEVLGFNSKLHEFKKFGEQLNGTTRAKMGNMLGEVGTPNAAHNDDGWALETASKRLAAEPAREKFVIVLSDGQPIPSDAHDDPRWDLDVVVSDIMTKTDQKLIGLGIGPYTDHVSRYYPNSRANIGISDMAKQIAAVLKDVIENYEKFRK